MKTLRRVVRRNAQSPGESHRDTATINMLPDNVLLEIFDFDQMRYYDYGIPAWNWQRLGHVCQRWRHIIFASPRRLDLTLLCTYGTPVRKNLGCWPPFPIVVDYHFAWNLTGRAKDYKLDVVAALEHPHRIRSVKLAVTRSLMVPVASVMQEPFLALKNLWLSSEDQEAPVLPDSFLGGSAPSLQKIYIVGISFPELPTLLLSAKDLVYLRLEDIPQGGYISPEAMVTGLAALTRLDSLWICFKSPTTLLEPIYLPFLTRGALTSLITFNFRGSSKYLEHLIARIDTPRLQRFEITYFNQLDYWIPQLSRFINRTENSEISHSRHAQVQFHIHDVCLELRRNCGEDEHLPSHLILRILCKRLDWQVSHLAQILGQSPTMVSSVDHIRVSTDEVDLQLESGWQDDIDDVDWLQLLRPFTVVKTLHGSQQLARRIALALDAVNGETVTEELPSLELLLLEDQPVQSIEQFLTVRQLSGNPVTFANPAPLTAGDVIVDGFIARTFSPEDANKYLILLLRSKHFVQYYGIVYYQCAWHITHNINLVHGTSPGALLQTTPVLDHDIGATQWHGTVVPQRRWVPTDEVEFRRHVESAVLQLPTFFVNHDGSLGFRLSDILRGCDHNLHHANSFASLGGRATTHIRINWPGYGYWKRQIATRDGTYARNPITVAHFMRHVGSSVDKFFRECMLNGYVATDPRWQIGVGGGITQEEVKIIGAIHVSAGSWMPIIQLRSNGTQVAPLPSCLESLSRRL